MKKIKQIPSHIRLAIDSLLNSCDTSLDELLNNNSKSSNTLSKKYLTIAEAEKYSACGRWTLYRKAKKGEIKTCKLSDAKSGKVLIEKASLDNWLESCKTTNNKDDSYDI